MQREWPSGHAGWKHGMHTMSMRAMLAESDSGGVYAGEDDPNSATSGARTAAAACISPESLLTTIDATDIRSMAVPRSVRPARSRTAGPAAPSAAMTAAAAALSFGEPRIQIAYPSSVK